MLFGRRHVGSVLAIAVVDRLDNCEELMRKGECSTNAEKMKKECPASCRKWQESVQTVKYARVDDGAPSFFELSAKNSTGHIVNFQRFEGYLTIVANTMKSCKPGATEAIYKAMENIHNLYPWTLEILLFTFENPEVEKARAEIASDAEAANLAAQFGIDLSGSCEDHEKAFKKRGRRIHVMEEVNLNGPKAHPVYKYLKKQFDFEGDELSTDFATFFFVSPDGDKLEAHIASSPESLKQSIRRHLEQDL